MKYCVSTIGEAARIPLGERTESDAVEIRFRAPAGLYQFSVIADAREFAWDELYFDLHSCGNAGQRTGPWDFDLRNGNKPLIPSYWVCLNGRRIGLWNFQRVSVEDIAHRRFRGRMAFYLEDGGETTLRLTPYRPMKLTWVSGLLENDPEDRMEAIFLSGGSLAENLPAYVWSQKAFWNGLREDLARGHQMYAEPLRRSFDWIGGKKEHEAQDMLMLFAADRLENRTGVSKAARKILNRYISAPHWGNPNEDGYGHDGDMGAAETMRSVAWMYHAFGPELDEETRAQTLEKLRTQGTRFFEQILLSRDYWGGSLLQDHGWRSMFDFGTAALHLRGIIPEAERWISYIIPRIRRGLEAMPRDGALPPSNYQWLALSVDGLTRYRDTLLAAGGGDIFDLCPVRPIIDYLGEVTRVDTDGLVLDGIENELAYLGGLGFLNRMALKFKDGRAAHLQKSFLQNRKETFASPFIESVYHFRPLWGVLTYDPSIPPQFPRRRTKPLAWFADSGVVRYRDDEGGASFTVQCGPWCGYHANLRASGPCDRIGLAPGAGHFTLSVGWKKPRLVTPECGYRLRSALNSCLLIDGKGQYGDIGYPMSLPSKEWRGEEIEVARWEGDRGFIRLQLAPAYPDEMGVAHYTRDFVIEGSERKIICRDHIVLDKPRRLSWLFQGKREMGISLKKGLVARLGSDPELRIEPVALGLKLEATIHETEVVWSYVSTAGRRPFDHVRYDSTEPVNAAAVDFILTW